MSWASGVKACNSKHTPGYDLRRMGSTMRLCVARNGLGAEARSVELEKSVGLRGSCCR